MKRNQNKLAEIRTHFANAFSTVDVSCFTSDEIRENMKMELRNLFALCSAQRTNRRNSFVFVRKRIFVFLFFVFYFFTYFVGTFIPFFHYPLMFGLKNRKPNSDVSDLKRRDNTFPSYACLTDGLIRKQ